MLNVLLAGGTGNLGRKIADELKAQLYNTTAIVRSSKKQILKGTATTIKVADVTKPAELEGICNGIDIVVSSLGKSVSPSERSKPSFYDIDFAANSNILAEAKKSGVKKFVYVSALGAEKYQNLTYFKVHHDFSELLKASGIDYTIVQPPAIFSAFADVLPMAKKGHLMNIGKGDKVTNPIYEGDLAKVVVDGIKLHNTTVAAGGVHTYSRREINEIIQNAAAPQKKVRTVPAGLIKISLPLLKLMDRNMYDKFAFFMEVMEHDTIAPKVGKTSLKEYLQQVTQRS